MTKEIWRSIKGFPGYEVSNHGNVRSYKKFGGARRGWYIADKPVKTLSPATDKRGYRGVNLGKRDGRPHYIRIAKLVTAAFLGPCPNGLEVCHNDGNPSNDRVENLRYDTHKSNMQDAIEQGNMGRSKGGKLTKEQVERIRWELSRIRRTHGATTQAYRKIVEDLGMSYQALCDLELGNIHVDAGGPIRKRRLYHKLSLPKDVVSIREKRCRGASLFLLAEDFRIGPSAISRIVRGITYSNIGGPIQDVDYPKRVIY